MVRREWTYLWYRKVMQCTSGKHEYIMWRPGARLVNRPAAPPPFIVVLLSGPELQNECNKKFLWNWDRYVKRRCLQVIHLANLCFLECLEFAILAKKLGLGYNYLRMWHPLNLINFINIYTPSTMNEITWQCCRHTYILIGEILL